MTQTNTNRATRVSTVPRRSTSEIAAQPAESLKLDALIHERVRLSFNDLKKLLEITDGNLSVHARKLEDAGYVKCTKSFVGRQPRSEFRLTASGRRALEGYLEQMESVIRAARK